MPPCYIGVLCVLSKKVSSLTTLYTLRHNTYCCCCKINSGLFKIDAQCSQIETRHVKLHCNNRIVKFLAINMQCGYQSGRRRWCWF